MPTSDIEKSSASTSCPGRNDATPHRYDIHRRLPKSEEVEPVEHLEEVEDLLMFRIHDIYQRSICQDLSIYQKVHYLLRDNGSQV